MNSKANFKARHWPAPWPSASWQPPLAAAPSQPVIAQAVQNANSSIDLSVGRGRLVSLPASMSDIFRRQ
jgi:pilus assembly protein CpaC